jgi:hypothetical protein
MRLRVTPTNIASTLMFLTSAVILVAVVLFTLHIHVVKDWTLTVLGGDKHAGDTITVQSVYTKTRPVSGMASSYIECKSGSGSYVRYHINDARADRAPGYADTGVVLKLPTDIPNLPTSCHISISVAYPVYPWRMVTEYAATKDFALLPNSETQTVILTSQTQSPALPAVRPVAASSSPSTTSSVKVSSSPNPAPSTTASQPDSSQSDSLLEQSLGIVNQSTKCIMNSQQMCRVIMALPNDVK